MSITSSVLTLEVYTEMMEKERDRVKKVEKNWQHNRHAQVPMDMPHELASLDILSHPPPSLVPTSIVPALDLLPQVKRQITVLGVALIDYDPRDSDAGGDDDPVLAAASDLVQLLGQLVVALDLPIALKLPPVFSPVVPMLRSLTPVLSHCLAVLRRVHAFVEAPAGASEAPKAGAWVHPALAAIDRVEKEKESGAWGAGQRLTAAVSSSLAAISDALSELKDDVDDNATTEAEPDNARATLMTILGESCTSVVQSVVLTHHLVLRHVQGEAEKKRGGKRERGADGNDGAGLCLTDAIRILSLVHPVAATVDDLVSSVSDCLGGVSGSDEWESDEEDVQEEDEEKEEEGAARQNDEESLDDVGQHLRSIQESLVPLLELMSTVSPSLSPLATSIQDKVSGQVDRARTAVAAYTASQSN
uniref:Uncharacterized protein n=1 Tax=Sexangularia sp. CB-2014 TaxID=1486929 RepID=A0A7S1VP85_9EUKA